MDIKDEGTDLTIETNDNVAVVKTASDKASNSNTLLLIINITMLAVGTCGGPLLMRLYFVHGGKRVWFSGWLLTAAWPLTYLLLGTAYIRRRLQLSDGGAKRAKLFFVDRRLFLCAAVIGVLVGCDNYMYSYGMARLPVSTSSLIIATQLVFTAVFAFLLVKQKMTAFSVNSVVLLTIGAAVLALHSSNDRPEGVSKKEYLMGFLLTLAAAVLYGVILPLVELTYQKARQQLTYVLVLEIQTVICLSATLFCTVGMLVNNDFKAISGEAKEFNVGEGKYYLVAVWCAVGWQLFYIGLIGVIFCCSSLISGVIIAALLPVTEILAVFFFDEKFSGEKGVSLALSLWGFVSYFYGDFKLSRKRKLARDQCINPDPEIRTPQIINHDNPRHFPTNSAIQITEISSSITVN